MVHVRTRWLHDIAGHDTHVINPSLLRTPYDAVKDFAPIGTLVATETLMVVTSIVAREQSAGAHRTGESETGAAQLRLLRQRDDNHLAMELFAMIAGIKCSISPIRVRARPSST